MREKLGSNVDKITKPGRHADGGCLYLLIKPDGRKTWVFRWRDRVTGKLRDKGLGPFGKRDVTLSEARDLAAECRREVRDNKDPIAEARKRRLEAIQAAQKLKTFKDCSVRYIKAHKPAWKNGKHTAQWTNTLNTYAAPLMEIPVNDITDDLVLHCLEPIWTTKTETATRVRQRIESVLDYATVRKYRSGDNPARWKGNLDQLLAKPTKIKKVKHLPALPYAEAGAFMAKLRAKDSMAAKALELQILTATRPGEVVGARWDEFNLTNATITVVDKNERPKVIKVPGIWTIPESRMKADKEHTIPLSPQAVKLLKKLDKVTDFVFPGVKLDRGMTTAAGMKLLKEIQPGITQHGFRSSFRDWAADNTAYPREVIEHALSHQLKDKAEAAYLRSKLLAKRQKLMTDWAKFCDKQPGQIASVTPIRKGAKS